MELVFGLMATVWATEVSFKDHFELSAWARIPAYFFTMFMCWIMFHNSVV